MTDDCDVLVIGGGPAGLAAAIDLRISTGLDVVVADAGGEPAERFGESLPPDILVLLERLGLSERFRCDGHLPCPGSVSIWGREEPGHNDFILNPMGPAWHISRSRFEAMLRVRAQETGALICSRTRAVAVRPPDGGFDVMLEGATAGKRWLHAGRVLDATGSRAWFARWQGATRAQHDRMVAVVRIAEIDSGTFTLQTVVEATSYGWWYCARLPDDRIVTVLVTERGEARALTSGGFGGWRRRLAATRLLAPRLAACRLAGERFRVSPVASFMLDRVEANRWYAVGDAASTWDPIVAQGIYKALMDAADATRAIAAALGRREPPPWSYQDRVAARFADYLTNRAYLYAREGRWLHTPFWRDRVQTAA